MFEFFKFLFAKKKEQVADKLPHSVAVLPEKPKTYLDYDWTPVIEFETGGRAYYEKVLKYATWPGGQSGITIGIGVDLGYIGKSEFKRYFSKYFTAEEIQLFEAVIGMKGTAAKEALSTVKKIQLSWDHATEAFVSWTLPKFWKMTNELWPGIEQLTEKAQVALVSIVFNRGPSIAGSTRTEMKAIKQLVVDKNYKGIAEQIRSMKRLWVGKGLDGLLIRREKEAKMVEEGI